MKHIYTIKGDEMPIVVIEPKPCACGNTRTPRITINFMQLMGRVLPQDKDKRVYMKERSDGFGVECIFQVENDEQRDKRMGITLEKGTDRATGLRNTRKLFD